MLFCVGNFFGDNNADWSKYESGESRGTGVISYTCIYIPVYIPVPANCNPSCYRLSRQERPLGQQNVLIVARRVIVLYAHTSNPVVSSVGTSGNKFNFCLALSFAVQIYCILHVCQIALYCRILVVVRFMTGLSGFKMLKSIPFIVFLLLSIDNHFPYNRFQPL